MLKLKRFWCLSKRVSLLIKGIIFVLLLAIMSVPIFCVQAAVSLQYFLAVSGETNQVTLKWATATELNNVGFFVQRSPQRNGTYTRINTEIIHAQGNGSTGATYEYVDSGLMNGTQYWYRLESIDSGQQSTYSDVISAIPGSMTTPTLIASATGTATLTPTPSPTMTGGTSFPTNTRTPTPINIIQPSPTLTSTIRPSPSLSPNPPSPTLIQANNLSTSPTPLNLGDSLSITPQAGQNDLSTGPTATLIPFPTVTITYPQTTKSSAPLPAFSDNNDFLGLNSLLSLLPLGLVILIWIGLGVWFYFSQRHLH